MIEIVRHESECWTWESVFATPDPRLWSVVQGRYQGWREYDAVPLRRREVPRIMVPVILNFGPRYRIAAPRSHAGAFAPRDSFIAGLHDASALTEADGTACCLQVNFTPLGAFRVFGVAMHELTNDAIEIEDLPGRAGAELVARLREAPDWLARFAMLDSFILKRLEDAPEPSAAVVWALATLQRTGGRVGIGALSRHTGLSRKRLVALFHDEVGLTPKTLARVVRFNRALRLLQDSAAPDTPAVRLTDVAQLCDYFDQAHFNRDFRAFTGCTPSAFLARSLPGHGGVQA